MEIPMRPIGDEQRQQLLNMAVNTEVASGAVILSMTQTSAVIVKAAKVNHVLHLLISVLTCFVWALIWILVAISERPKCIRLEVDEFGVVHRSAEPTLFPNTESLTRRWEPHNGLWRRDTEQ